MECGLPHILGLGVKMRIERRRTAADAVKTNPRLSLAASISSFQFD